ncbi:MAG TPA: GGDEF domain-containing protein, partial [Geobacteraceae bacterium]
MAEKEKTIKREPIEGAPWFKNLVMRIGIYRGDPTSRELEMLADIQGRVRLVVKSRWILLLLLTIYGIYAGGFFFLSGNGSSLEGAQFFVLMSSFAAVVIYNLFYQVFYRELSHFIFVNHVQILLDIFFVTILIHFSGGAVSWFWTVYLILTLEAAFLLERKADTWFIGAVGALTYGALLTAEYHHVIQPVKMPLIDSSLQHNFVYGMLVWFWVSIMNATVAIIAAFLMGVIREREWELKLMVVKDQMTNLYNR